ncbi:hypothetical protein ABK040_003127 [Willaertia magna]
MISSLSNSSSASDMQKLMIVESGSNALSNAAAVAAPQHQPPQQRKYILTIDTTPSRQKSLNDLNEFFNNNNSNATTTIASASTPSFLSFSATSCAFPSTPLFTPTTASSFLIEDEYPFTNINNCCCRSSRMNLTNTEVYQQLHQSFQNGYFHIDCVESYFEYQVGICLPILLKEFKKERTEITIGVKIDLQKVSNNNEKGFIIEFVDQSLRQLKTDYIDIFVLDFGYKRQTFLARKDLRNLWKQIKALQCNGVIHQSALRHVTMSELNEILQFDNELKPIVICPINI